MANFVPDNEDFSIRDCIMWKKIKIKFANNINGILGTLSFHMILAIVFLIVKISTTKNTVRERFMIDFAREEYREQIEKERARKNELEAEQFVEQAMDEIRRNIAVNRSQPLEEEISTEKFVNEVEKQLEAGRSDEWPDNQSPPLDLSDPGFLEPPMPENETRERKAQNVEGPTTIYYELEGRHHLYLPSPVYLCEGGGVIKVEIDVNRSGYVIRSRLLTPVPDENRKCLARAAIESAGRTRFNPSMKAQELQKGTITYHFMPQ